MAADPKPEKRIKADQNDWFRLRQEKVAACRVCGIKPQFTRMELHHLVPRGMGGTIGGDDVADNLVPLCPRCHAAVEHRDHWASSLLGQSLTGEERAYTVEKKSHGYLFQRYGVKEGT